MSLCSNFIISLPTLKKRMPMLSRNILLLVLFLASLLPACKEKDVMPAELQEINEMLEGKPGNPYYPLRDYKQKAHEQPEAIRMYYDFLTIKFENRHMVYDRRSELYHHSDSLITNVLRYYEETDNRKLLPEVYYYAGRIYAKMGDAPCALDYYHQALNAASAQTDTRLMQRIYFQMGHLFWFQSVYNEALKAQLKALSYKQLAADTLSEIFILKSLGGTYADLGKTDSAFFYYEEALRKAETIRNASLAFYVKENMAALYLSQGDYTPAWNLLESPPADIDESVRTVLYQLKAQLYHQTGEADSAMHYNHLIEDRGSVYNKQKASLDMANILSGQNRYKEAAGYFQQYVVYTDSIQKRTRTEALTKAQATYNYQLRERENNQLKLKNAEQRTLILVYLLAGLLITGAGTAYLFYLRNLRRKQNERLNELERQREDQFRRSKAYIERNNALIQDLEKQLASTSDENLQMKQLLQIQQEQLRQRNIQAEAEMREQELAIQSFHRSDIYIKFHQAEDFSELSEADWLVLHQTIDRTFNSFTNRLYALSTLDERELRICLLVKAEIQPAGIARLMGRAKSTITSARKNLFEKQCGKKGSAEDFDRFIQGF